jgi:hypothetical protein
MYWNAHKTNKNDRRIVKDLLKAHKDYKNFDEEARTEILKEIRRLVGFSIPEGVLFIIKSYLILPRDIFLAKSTFLSKIVHIPSYHLLTIAENAEVIDELGDTTNTKWTTKQVINTITNAISSKPQSQQISLYKHFDISPHARYARSAEGGWGFKGGTPLLVVRLPFNRRRTLKSFLFLQVKGFHPLKPIYQFAGGRSP